MKRIKPGRGVSGMNFIGSIVAVVFGIFWTVIAINLSANTPFGLIGIIFPLFGVLFIIVGIAQAVFHYRNATGKDRYSIFDITDSMEEGDPSDKWIKEVKSINDEKNEFNETKHSEINYCQFCGMKLDLGYKYCPKCGKTVR